MDSEKLLKLLPELQALAGQLPAIEELLARAPAEVRDKIKPIEEFPERKRRQSEIQALVIDHIWAKAQANSRKDGDGYWRVSVKRVTSKEGTTEVGSAFDILLSGVQGVETGNVLPAILSYFPSTGDYSDRWIGFSAITGFWARLTSEAGGGYYSWKRLKDDAATDYSPAQTGTSNAKEVQAVLGLKVGASIGKVIWLERDKTDAPNEWRFTCGREVGTAVIPAVMLPADFEQETIAEDTWDRDSPPAEKDGVTVRVQMRTVYNDAAGTPTLWAIYREFTYDSLGSLKSISLEHRVSIDVPEEC